MRSIELPTVTTGPSNGHVVSGSVEIENALPLLSVQQSRRSGVLEQTCLGEDLVGEPLSSRRMRLASGMAEAAANPTATEPSNKDLSIMKV